MLSIAEYYEKVKEFKYEEHLVSVSHDLTKLTDFLKFSELSLELRIHISSMLIRRSVGVTNGIWMPDDVNWLINNFIQEYKSDLADPARWEANYKSILMIQGDKSFSDCLIGRIYMYTAIEFYLKHKLGFKVYPNSEEDISSNKKITFLSIGTAYNRVKRANFRVSSELNLIDKYFKERAKSMGYQYEELQNLQIQGRLNSLRNSSLHGHYQFYHAEGTLLALLFILLHYC